MEAAAEIRRLRDLVKPPTRPDDDYDRACRRGGFRCTTTRLTPNTNTSPSTCGRRPVGLRRLPERQSLSSTSRQLPTMSGGTMAALRQSLLKSFRPALSARHCSKAGSRGRTEYTLGTRRNQCLKLRRLTLLSPSCERGAKVSSRLAIRWPSNCPKWAEKPENDIARKLGEKENEAA